MIGLDYQSRTEARARRSEWWLKFARTLLGALLACVFLGYLSYAIFVGN